MTGVRLIALVPVLLALAALAAACGGGDEEEGPILSPITAEYAPVVISSDIAVGPNRFVVGLVDADNEPVAGAELHFRFLAFDGSEQKLKFESDPTPVTIEKSYTHTHEDGTVESHGAGELGVYVANVEFDAAGRWALEVSGRVEGADIEPQTTVFDVREESLSPNIGDPAPLSVQPILSDVEDISEIDTSDPPNPAMHQITIADAVQSGKPTVIVFATPAFCVSRVCGPTKGVVDDLFEEYGDSANFIHVEPYDLEKARSGEGLVVLPFIVDADGKIAGKYEGVVTLEEMEAALEQLVAVTGR